MLKCDCRHLGHCPVEGQPDTRRTDLDGRLLWRDLYDGERTDVMHPGDLVVTKGQGVILVLGRALDPERVRAYGLSKIGRSCKAQRAMWRMRNRAPDPVAETDPG